MVQGVSEGNLGEDVEVPNEDAADESEPEQADGSTQMRTGTVTQMRREGVSASTAKISESPQFFRPSSMHPGRVT